MTRWTHWRDILLTLAALAIGQSTLAQSTATDTAQKGSLLVLPNVEVRWDADGDVIQDTFIELTNDAPGNLYVAMLWVNGDPPVAADAGTGERAHTGWNSVDPWITLTIDQPTYWSAATGSAALPPWHVLDPGTPRGRPDSEGGPDRLLRGYILIWATNLAGQQLAWNQLSAHATVVHYEAQSAWRYSAYAFQADANVTIGDAIGTPGVLRLDGVEYEACPDQLLLQFLANGAALSSAFPAAPTVGDTDLTLLAMTMDHRQVSTGPFITSAMIDVWDMNETHFGGQRRCVTGWDQALLSAYAAPNFFAQPLLTTDMGKARIDAAASAECPGSAAAPLLGVAAQYLGFAPTPASAHDITGATLVGTGTEPSIIRFDLPPGEPELRSAPLTRTSMPEAVVPGVSTRAKANATGSLLIFPGIELRWDAMGNLKRDTFIQLTNDAAADVTVRLQFVNGDAPAPPPERSGYGHPGWNRICGAIDLTHDQPTYWSAATGLPAGVPSFIDLDSTGLPGRPANDGTDDRVLRGFAVAWAVDGNGAEIHWNHLTGRATVVDVLTTSAWAYSATAVAALEQGGAVGAGDPTGTPFALNLDGLEYAQVYSQLLLKFFAEGSLALSAPAATVRPYNNLSLLVVPADLRATPAAPLTTRAVFDVWNENEVHFSGTGRCFTWWDQRYLEDYHAPNNFLVAVLQTDVGKARCSGVASPWCPGSSAAPLLGVLRTFLYFNSGSGYAEAGETLVGAGTASATILVDAACGDLFAAPGDTDTDGDVDLQDFAVFQNCYAATPPLYAPGCNAAQFAACDADNDQDVDLADHELLEPHLAGPH